MTGDERQIAGKLLVPALHSSFAAARCFYGLVTRHSIKLYSLLVAETLVPPGSPSPPPAARSPFAEKGQGLFPSTFPEVA